MRENERRIVSDGAPATKQIRHPRSFFLMLGPSAASGWKVLTAFGKIIEGMDVLDAFEKLELNGGDAGCSEWK